MKLNRPSSRLLLPILSIGFCLLFWSCKKKKETPNLSLSEFHGLFVLNEGQWTYNNATLDFYDPSQHFSRTPEVFYQVNQTPLGDVANDAILVQDTLYIVVNNSRLLYKVQMPTLKLISQTEFPDGSSPRTFLPLSTTKAYVNSLLDNRIYILNPVSMSIVGEIPIQNFCEDLAKHGQYVFATCGNYAYPNKNDKLAIVDPLRDEVIQYVPMPIENPGDVDSVSDQWVAVACRGDYATTGSALVLFNVKTQQIDTFFTMPFSGFDLFPYKDSLLLWVTERGLAKLNLYTLSFEPEWKTKQQLAIPDNHLLYTAFYLAPLNLVAVCDAGYGATPGRLLLFDTQWNLIAEQPTGIFPGTVFFYP